MRARTLSGRYRLDEQIGAGGMATVWRGFDLWLQRTVAVKLLAPHLAESANARHRADTEARAVARLTHANIAAVHDVGRVRRGLRGRVPYTVMEFVDGPTLQSRLRRTDPMGWATVARICAQVAAALTAAHERGVVHRDVKPDNIMLTPVGVKVVDFGLAAFLPLPAAGPIRMRLGTPEYMAPEQLRGDPVTAAGDVYAFGMVLYRLLTGGLPWAMTSRRGTIRLRETSPVIRVPPMSGVPSEMIALCDRCLSNEPANRPTSRHAADVLRTVLAEHDPDGSAATLAAMPPAVGVPAAVPPPIAPQSEPATRRRAARAAVAAVVALAGLALLVHPPWRTQADLPRPGQHSVAAAPATGCVVRYIAHRTPDTFTAELTLTAPVPPDWTLQLLLAPGQQVTDVSGPRWTQHGRSVTRTGTGTRSEDSAAAVVFILAGDLTRSGGAAPTAFDFNGTTCRPSVVIFTTESARPGTSQSPANSTDPLQRTP